MYICFTKTIRTNNTGYYGHASYVIRNPDPNALEDMVIPKHIPVKVVKYNKAHVFIEYKDKVVKLRRIVNRMYPAGKAGKILFGEG